MSDDFIFRGSLADLDPAVADIIERETQRQDNTIILIASESESPEAIHEAIASPFAHVYAEGYPRESSRKQTQEQILDIDYELAYYRRNSDPRFYKGVEYADVVEALTRRRAADLFAANGIKPEQMYINVQPLSGGPANSAVYTALLKPGDTIMGLKLSDGGHLSHGAKVNRSGQAYNSVSYIVDPALEAINYDAVEEMAMQVKPNIIVAGFSAYPLVIDWQRFRDIADKCGALMLADISHISGLIAAGVHPSPIGIADVVMTTTHKSLCGPRGAMIMTHRKDIGRKVDSAVFPGEQGGPHLNTMVALAVALKLADTDKFRELQKRIVSNAKRLAERLMSHGLTVAFGGSENHLLLLDCKSIRVDGVPLTGDIASRILDVVGIVLNRNNIPGDKSALNPFGVRIGTVWPSQRGFGDAEIDKLGDAIALVYKGCTPFYYRGRKGKLFRSKVDPAALAEARAIVADLVGAQRAAPSSAEKSISIRGNKAAAFLDAATTSNVIALAVGEAQNSHVYGHGIDATAVIERRDGDYAVHFADAETAAAARQWFADLSDGYVHFGSLHGKLPGPVVVKTIEAEKPAASGDAVIASKPFFVGMDSAESAPDLPEFVWKAPAGELQKTALHARHGELGAKLIDFGGYDMPVWYSSVSEEHEAVRTAAGLFDVSHMGVFDVKGLGSAEFISTVTSNDATALKVGDSQYTYLFDPNGRIIDDLLVYRLEADHFLLVVNAGNNDEDWAWLNAVNNGEVRISNERPGAKIANPITLRDLRDPQHGADCRVDIALQGPKSRDILLAMCNDEALAGRITKLAWGNLTQGQLGDFDVIISRTGYTGERMAFELFVHPDQVVAFWDALLEAGAPMGLLPCGLAARDSTRTEAGLPLHGHELAGPLAINPLEAGFGTFIKLAKPFFVGREAYLAEYLDQKRTLVRFRMDDKGVRRPEMGDPILDKRGKVVGTVTSCAIDRDGMLLGLALVPMDLRKVGTSLTLYQTGGGKRPVKGADKVAVGARLPMPNTATVISRFPKS